MHTDILCCIYGMCIMFYGMMAAFFWHRRSTILSRLIVALTSVIALQCVKDLFFIGDFTERSLHLWRSITALDLAVVPLYGAILTALCSPGKPKTVHILYHEIPFIVLPVLYILTGREIFFAACVALAGLYGSGYALWTWITIPHYRRQLKEKFSYTENIDLKWLRTIMLSFFAILGLYVVDSIIVRVAMECLYMLGSLILWMFICYFLYRHESIMSELADTEPADPAPIAPEAANELAHRIEQLFAIEKIYLNPVLKLTDVAARVGTNRTYISRFFNQDENSSFYDYVNRYRVEHACRLLKQSSDTIESIAEQSGFNSKATFYRVFSNIKNTPPSKYRKNLYYNKLA